MKIAILGCLGFLGSSITQNLLSQGHQVYGIDSLYWKEESKKALQKIQTRNFFFIEDDVRNIERRKDTIAKCDIIIPLAALVGMPLCEKFKADAQAVNSDSIGKLVKLLSPNQKIINFNSNSGYGSSPNKCTEETTLNPLSVYAKTKAEGEKQALAHKNCVALRLATVFGVSPRMRFDLLVNNFVETLFDKGKIVLYEPEFYRNYVGINDVVNCINFLLHNDLRGIYNLGNDALNMTKLQLAQRIEQILGFYNAVEVIEGQSDPDKRNYSVSSEKLYREGFRPNQGLDQTVTGLYKLCQQIAPADRKSMRNY